MRAGKGVIGKSDGAEQLMEISRGRFAPDANDSIFRDVVEFMYFKCLEQKMDAYLMEFDMLRGKAESRMQTGAGFPDEFVSVFCTQNAGLIRNEKTMVLASLGVSEYRR